MPLSKTVFASKLKSRRKFVEHDLEGSYETELHREMKFASKSSLVRLAVRLESYASLHNSRASVGLIDNTHSPWPLFELGHTYLYWALYCQMQDERKRPHDLDFAYQYALMLMPYCIVHAQLDRLAWSISVVEQAISIKPSGAARSYSRNGLNRLVHCCAKAVLTSQPFEKLAATVDLGDYDIFKAAWKSQSEFQVAVDHAFDLHVKNMNLTDHVGCDLLWRSPFDLIPYEIYMVGTVWMSEGNTLESIEHELLPLSLSKFPRRIESVADDNINRVKTLMEHLLKGAGPRPSFAKPSLLDRFFWGGEINV